jgi:hypothetical protein
MNGYTAGGRARSSSLGTGGPLLFRLQFEALFRASENDMFFSMESCRNTGLSDELDGWSTEQLIHRISTGQMVSP